MHKRYLSIWFPHFATDRFTRLHPELKDKPFLLYVPEHGRMVVSASSRILSKDGIAPGMVVADVRAILPFVEVIPADRVADEKQLRALAEWCIRFTPVVAIDPPDGLILDISGCAHLWGGEISYLKTITDRLRRGGFDVRVAIADTIGAAWAIARYGRDRIIVEPGSQAEALFSLPPVVLRLDAPVLQRMEKTRVSTDQAATLHTCIEPAPAFWRRFTQQAGAGVRDSYRISTSRSAYTYLSGTTPLYGTH